MDRRRLNNSSEIIQLAEDLKVEVTQQASFTNAAAMSVREKLQDLYHDLIIQDLDFALSKKVDADLWNCAFKQHISIMQQKAKDRKNAKRSECQSTLMSFLETSNAFYLLLLQEICYTFDLNDIPGFKSSFSLGLFPNDCLSKCRSVRTRPTKASCQYIVQDCLIHLGDIGRYRNLLEQARVYYELAIVMGPSNGRSYNQLGILFQNKPDYELNTLFYLSRAITVKHAFLSAESNFSTTVAKLSQNEGCEQLVRSSLTSWKDFLKVFCYFNSLVHLEQNVESILDAKDCLIASLSRLICNKESDICWRQLVRMAYLCIFNIWCLTHSGNSVLSKFAVDAEAIPTIELDVSKRQVLSCAVELVLSTMGSFLRTMALQCSTFKEVTRHAFGPALKMLLEWLSQTVFILDLEEFEQRRFLWPRVVSVLNLFSAGVDDQETSAEKSGNPKKALQEDFEVQGFMPLRETLKLLKLPCHQREILSGEESLKERAIRLIALGEKLCELKPKHIEAVLTSGKLSFETNVTIMDDIEEERSQKRLQTRIDRCPYNGPPKTKPAMSKTTPSDVSLHKPSNSGKSLDNEKRRREQGRETRKEDKEASRSRNFRDSNRASNNAAGSNSEKTKASNKIVTFGAEPPKTIERTPSPQKAIDLASESDFPSLNMNMKQEVHTFNRQPNFLIPGIPPPNKTNLQNTNFSSPRLAMSFPGLPMGGNNLQSMEANKIASSPPGAPRYSQQKREHIPDNFPMSNPGIIGSSPMSNGASSNDASNLFPSAMLQPGLFPPFPPPPLPMAMNSNQNSSSNAPPMPFPSNNQGRQNNSHLLPNSGQNDHSITPNSSANQFSPFGQNGLFGASFQNVKSGSSDENINTFDSNRNAFSTINGFPNNHFGTGISGQSKESFPFSQQGSTNNNNMASNSLFPTLFNPVMPPDSGVQNSASQQNNSRLQNKQQGKTRELGNPFPSKNSMFPSGNNAPFVNKQFPSGSSNATITTEPNLSKLQNILFGGFPNTQNTSVPQAPSVSAFDSIWTNNNMFPAINNSSMPLLQHQLSDNVNGNGSGIDQKSSNGPLFPTNHLFQQQRSLNSQTQDSIPDLMSLETKPPNSNFMNSSSSSNSQVQSLFESSHRGPLQRQSSGGEGGNKLLAGLFGNATALDIGAGLGNMMSPGMGRPSQFSNYDVNSWQKLTKHLNVIL